MANTSTVIILVAGGMTFTNEWYGTNKPNWRIPVATVLLAALFDAFAHVDEKAATLSSVIVLIGAFTAHINGKSIADRLAALYPATTQNVNPSRIKRIGNVVLWEKQRKPLRPESLQSA